MIWIGILLIGGFAVYLSLAHRRWLSTWRGFGCLVASLLLILAWLRWQWPLWQSPNPFLQTVNLLVGLLAWGLFIALLISSLLLLIRQDASVVFMAFIWAFIPVMLLIVGGQYRRIERFVNAPLEEMLLWVVFLPWVAVMMCLAPLAFLGHYAILIYKEFKADGVNNRPVTRDEIVPHSANRTCRAGKIPVSAQHSVDNDHYSDDGS